MELEGCQWDALHSGWLPYASKIVSTHFLFFVSSFQLWKEGRTPGFIFPLVRDEDQHGEGSSTFLVLKNLPQVQNSLPSFGQTND